MDTHPTLDGQAKLENHNFHVVKSAGTLACPLHSCIFWYFIITSLATWPICHVAMGQLAPALKALLAKGPFLPHCGQATKGGWGQPQSCSKTWLGGWKMCMHMGCRVGLWGVWPKKIILGCCNYWNSPLTQWATWNTKPCFFANGDCAMCPSALLLRCAFFIVVVVLHGGLHVALYLVHVINAQQRNC